MARSLIVSLLFVCVLLVSSAHGRFISLEDEAEKFAKLSLSQYLDRLEGAQRHATTPSEKKDLARHLRYYRALHKQGTVPRSVADAEHGTAHDCVPFELQPALFDASAMEVSKARAIMLDATENGALVAEDAPCPLTHVLIPRPLVTFEPGTPHKLTLAQVPPKRPRAHTNSAYDRYVPTAGDDALPIVASKGKKGTGPDTGYSYVDPVPQQTSIDTKFTYTILGVGSLVDTPMAQVPRHGARGVAHSINQCWWAWLKKGHNFYNATLEAGWIASRYWSVKPTTTVFVFSTPNGYVGNVDQVNSYNEEAGFVYYPGVGSPSYGAPAPGQSISGLRFMFNYSVLPNQGGFRMDLRSFYGRNPQVNQDFVFNQTAIPYGHWPMKRYLTHGYRVVPGFNMYQTGQEIDQGYNASDLTAAGKIFGWGAGQSLQDFNRYDVLNKFQAIGVLKTIGFQYATSPGFGPDTGALSSLPSSHWIEFNGTTCGDYCINKTNTTVNKKTQDNQNSHRDVGVVIGTLFGCLVLLGLIAGGVMWYNSRKKKIPEFGANYGTHPFREVN